MLDIACNVSVASGNKWDCIRDFQWVLKLHERGALVNGDHLTCKDAVSQKESWIEWKYSIIKRETNKKVNKQNENELK